ncbi:unnamed protein product [Peronospora effusa]|nr:unnamed protein product [Peronospora effusa]
MFSVVDVMVEDAFSVSGVSRSSDANTVGSGQRVRSRISTDRISGVHEFGTGNRPSSGRRALGFENRTMSTDDAQDLADRDSSLLLRSPLVRRHQGRTRMSNL